MEGEVQFQTTIVEQIFIIISLEIEIQKKQVVEN